MRPALFAIVAAALASTACTRTPTTSAPSPAPTTKAESPSEPPHADEARKAVRDFHVALASGKIDEQTQALTRILCKPKDIEALFPKHERFWGVLTFGLHGIEDDLPKIGRTAAAQGEIKSIRIVDLRRSGGSSLTSKVAADIPIYQAVVEYKSKKFSFDPLFYVNGRWIWFPNAEKLAAVLPAEK